MRTIGVCRCFGSSPRRKANDGPGLTAAREKIHARPVGIGSDTRQKGSGGRGRVVRPAALIRAPARGGAVWRSREPPRARLNDLGSSWGTEASTFRSRSPGYRLEASWRAVWPAGRAGVLSAGSPIQVSVLDHCRETWARLGCCRVRLSHRPKPNREFLPASECGGGVLCTGCVADHCNGHCNGGGCSGDGVYCSRTSLL